MAKVCVLLAQGFEEIEAITIIDVLRRGEIDVTTLAVRGTGPGSLEVAGSHDVTVRADMTLTAGAKLPWDMVILPGGVPGSMHLRDDADVQALLKKQNDRGGKLGAICAAPLALAAAGILQGRRATCYPSVEKELTGATCVVEPVVRDGNVVTSRGIGTSLDFALDLVRDLRSREVAEKLRSAMLVRT